MFKKILIALFAVIIVFLIVVAFQPSEFTITRSASIAAPADVVFAQVNDFRKWGAWSPWEKMDPDMKRTYEGPESGEGASYAWAGNNKVGEGKMTILKSQAPQTIDIRLDFLKPMAATHTAEFTFKPAGATTDVTWSMTGHKNFVSKGFCLFMNMDKMVGGDFEKGLAQLKSVAEGEKKS